MDRQRAVDAAEALNQDDAASVAQSLQRDFIGLIAIFDRQLANGTIVDGKARSKISDAKAAAQRGLGLAHDLIELLQIDR